MVEANVNQSNQAEVETYLTEDLLSELCSVLTFPNEKVSAQALELVPDSAVLAEVESVDEGEDEPTIVEALKVELPPEVPAMEASPPVSERSNFYRFLSEPYYKTRLALWLEKYFEEVRQRTFAYQEYHRLNYPDSGFRKLQSLMQRIIARAKENLAQDTYREYCERTQHLED